MSNGTFVLALAVGAGLLATWIHVRFPALAPERLGRTIAHAGVAFVFLQLATRLGDSAGAYVAVFGFVLPALTYALLTALWMIQHAQTALGLQR
jgi:hypothetical protein